SFGSFWNFGTTKARVKKTHGGTAGSDYVKEKKRLSGVILSAREKARQGSVKIVSCSIQDGFRAYMGSRGAVILCNHGLKLLDHIGGVLNSDFYPLKFF